MNEHFKSSRPVPRSENTRRLHAKFWTITKDRSQATRLGSMRSTLALELSEGDSTAKALFDERRERHPNRVGLSLAGPVNASHAPVLGEDESAIVWCGCTRCMRRREALYDKTSPLVGSTKMLSRQLPRPSCWWRRASAVALKRLLALAQCFCGNADDRRWPEP